MTQEQITRENINQENINQENINQENINQENITRQSARAETENNSDAELQRRLVLLTQKGLPLASRPYLHLAQQLGVSESDVIELFKRMQQQGQLRRIAAVPNHYKLGYVANGMSVWNVPDERIAELGEKVGALEFVSHCYQRPRHGKDWPYNLFAMVHARSRTEAMIKVQAIADVLAEDNLGSEVLFSTRILKKQGLRLRARPSAPSEKTAAKESHRCANKGSKKSAMRMEA